MEREEQQLLGRLRFASAAAGRLPPRPAVEDGSQTDRASQEVSSFDAGLSARQRVQCAELALARENFNTPNVSEIDLGPLALPWTLDRSVSCSPRRQ